MGKGSRSSRHVELERKFAVPESGLSPSFDGMSGVVTRVERQPTQHLEAVYFDTAHHDLAANRITLRRRSGGSDAGWHLKLPPTGDAEARTELRAPLDDDLPAELRDMVLAIVRDRPLQPVARISTARDVTLLHGPDGAPLEIGPKPRFEVEVVVHEGSPDVVGGCSCSADLSSARPRLSNDLTVPGRTPSVSAMSASLSPEPLSCT